MKLPSKLKVGGQIITIEQKADVGDAGEYFGMFISKKSLILIDKDASETQQESTLIHEILEAINDYNDLGLEHKTICILEHNLYQIYVDNFKK